MLIPSYIIKDYLSNNFTDYVETSAEFMINSLFISDSKHHLSINRETGLWQCFKSKESGNFIQLVALTENISYDEASLSIRRKLLGTPELMFSSPSQKSAPKNISGLKDIKEELKNFKELDLSTSQTSSIPENLAKRFIRERALTGQKFYLATSGKYINRIIIPYEFQGELVYFQARQLTFQGMKYLNPTAAEFGVKSSDILFPFNESEDYVIVTEGPIDAITLQDVGVNATSIQGSMLSYSQVEQLRGKNIILSFDNDEAGKLGFQKAVRMLKMKNCKESFKLNPPLKYKDWNEFRQHTTKSEFLKYISSNIVKVDFSYEVTSKLG